MMKIRKILAIAFMLLPLLVMGQNTGGEIRRPVRTNTNRVNNKPARQEIDYNTYNTALVEKAESGDANAQYKLGDCYYYGNGISQNYIEAVEWYSKAANQGNIYAQYNLGTCYEYDHGVTTQDYEKAFEWYTKAAEQGNARAQYYLGNCYNYSRGVAQDYTKAIEWYSKAADQGDEDAIKILKTL